MAEQAGDLQGAWPGREPVIRNDPLDPERDGVEADGQAGRGGLAGRPLLRHSREGGNLVPWRIGRSGPQGSGDRQDRRNVRGGALSP